MDLYCGEACVWYVSESRMTCVLQVSVVEEASSGEMLLQTGEAVMGIMKEFQVLVLPPKHGVGTACTLPSPSSAS